MSANSYPSPISSVPSPRLHASPVATRPSTPTHVLRARQNTHRSLQTAAADLEVVFARLEQVRASLMQLSNRMAEPAAQSRAREQLGPSHDAIMLTGEDEAWEPQPRVQGNSASEESDLLSAFETSFRRAVQAHNSLAHLAEQNSAARQAISANGLPPDPPPPTRIPYQSLPTDTQSSRYLDLALRDDGFTVLGRHVNAREAAALRRRSTLIIDDILPPNDQISPTSQPISRLPPLEEGPPSAQRPSQNSDPNELRRLNQIQNQLSSPATSPLLWRQEPRRRRPNRTDTRPPSTRTSGSGPGFGTGSTVPSDPSRLSMLSSFSIQNFSTPVSAAPSLTRPLLFEEPESYTEANSPLDGDFMFDDVPFGRNYIIRRHVNAEGRERVQNINLDFMEANSNAFAWHLPQRDDPHDVDNIRRRTMLQSFQERAQRPPSTTMNPSGPHAPPLSRRRGWARLDPDGNEIPSDEEEELERYRTEYRIRATNRARANAPMHSDSMPAPPDATRTMMYGSVMDSVANVNDAYYRRVRQPQREPAVTADKDVEGYSFGSYYPLPMPLEAMVCDRTYRDVEASVEVEVDRMASFAGR